MHCSCTVLKSAKYGNPAKNFAEFGGFCQIYQKRPNTAPARAMAKIRYIPK